MEQRTTEALEATMRRLGLRRPETQYLGQETIGREYCCEPDTRVRGGLRKAVESRVY
jgi:hypothetical protein